LRHYAKGRKVARSILDVIGFFNRPNLSSRAMVLGSTQLLIEISIRNLSGGGGRQARKADNITAISEPIIYKMWEPRRLTNLWASTANYRDSFTFYLHLGISKGLYPSGQISEFMIHAFHACCISCPSHPARFHNPSNIRSGIQIMNSLCNLLQPPVSQIS
jgi:hypothetical protein